MRMPRKRLFVWLIIPVVAVLLLLTGWPQRWAVEWGAERALGARVEIRGLKTRTTVLASSVRIFDDAGESPVLDARDVVIKYRLWPKDGRWLESVTAGFVGIDLDAPDAQHSNFDFLSRLLNKPKTETKRDPLAYVPREFRIAVLSGRVRLPGMAVAVNGLHAEGSVVSREQLALTLKGDALDGEWKVQSQGMQGAFRDGRVDVVARSEGYAVRLEPMTVLLPGLVDIDGKAQGRIESGANGMQRVAEIDLPRCKVEGVDLSQARWSFVPFPIEFRSADASGTKVKLLWNAEGFFIPEAEVRASAEALELGDWYDGSLQVMGQGKERHYTLEAVLGAGQKVVAEAQGTPLEAKGVVRIDGWTREQVLDALPASAEPMLEKVPELKGLSGEVAWQWAKPGYEVKGSLEPEMEGVGAVTVAGRGAVGGGALFEGKVGAEFGGGTIAADASFGERVKIDAALDKVDLAALVGLVSETAIFDKAGSKVSGTVRIGDSAGSRAVAKGNRDGVTQRLLAGYATSKLVWGCFEKCQKLPPLPPRRRGGESIPPACGGVGGGLSFALHHKHPQTSLEVAYPAGLVLSQAEKNERGSAADMRGVVDLTLAPSPLPQVLVADEVSVKGAFRVAGGGASGKEFAFASGEDVRGGFRDWSWRDGVLKGKLEVESPAERLTPLNKLSISGLLTGSAAVTYAKGVVTAPFEAALDEAGYKTYSSAPGVPVTATGKVRYEVKAAQGTVDKLALDWTDGTTLRVEPLRFTPEPKFEETAYTLESDLAPLIYLGMLPDVSGTATAKGAFRYAGAFTTEAEVDLTAEQMTFPGKLAVAGGAALKGTLRYAGGMAAEGLFGAAKLTAAGATANNVRGPFVLKDGTVTSHGLEAELWDGKMGGDAEAGLFVEGMPVKASFTAEALNLDTFTREYRPPKSRFTGVGGGTASVVWSRKGFEGFSVDLATSEGFAVNRDLVYQMLMSEYIKDAKVGRRVDKVVDEVLGEEDMRTFKSGELKLGLESEDISGQARLESESLNLTVDINMDPEALASLLKLRQEENLEKIDTIKAEPVQLGK